MDKNAIFHFMNQTQQQQLEKILDANQYTKRFGLQLTGKDTELLLQSRKEVLKEQKRIEFSEGILSKLIFTFCDSPYLHQDNYVETLETLQELFYRYKNESSEELSDDELLEYMKEKFDGECHGSLDYLEGSCLENYCRALRRGERPEEDFAFEEGEGEDELE